MIAGQTPNAPFLLIAMPILRSVEWRMRALLPAPGTGCSSQGRPAGWFHGSKGSRGLRRCQIWGIFHPFGDKTGSHFGCFP